jgi:hypothetical protein
VPLGRSGLGPFLIHFRSRSRSQDWACPFLRLRLPFPALFTPSFSCNNRRSLAQHKYITLLQPLIPNGRSKMKLALVPFAAFVASRVAALTPLSSIDLNASTLPTEYIVELSSSSQLGNLVGEKRTSSVCSLLLFLISWG